MLDIFVVDSWGRLTGGVPIGRLLTANMATTMAGVMEPDVPSLPQTVSLEEAADILLARRLLAMPIVDKAGLFVGVVDLVDVIEGASGQVCSADPERT
jgi:Mg/Co/Ni transporter MgtE